MKKFLLVPVFVVLATTTPATAQNYPDAGLNRLDDPNYGWPQSYYRRGYDPNAQCRIIRERSITSDGTVIYTTREICG
jgi:hypothetical protein